MKFSPPLIEGRLIRRYKRFLADVTLADGEVITAHCPNTGSMLGCQPDGARVWMSVSDNVKRKYPHTWELVELAPNILAGINTSLSNRLVKEAIEQGVITELQGYAAMRSEVRYGSENSRIDLLLEDHPELPPCYVEVKNVTLGVEGIGLFPDAVTTRGSKHLRELMEVVRQGQRAVLVYCVQHSAITEVRPADHIDPDYGANLRDAIQQGIEVIAYQALLSPQEVVLTKSIPINCL
jgi:sugar fermentation stimulation protein A